MLTMSELPIERWTEWERRDDWHNLFVGSDIRQMLGEIIRLRSALSGASEVVESEGLTSAELGELGAYEHGIDWCDNSLEAVAKRKVRHDMLKSRHALSTPPRLDGEREEGVL
jgi:hypothetical protein